MQIAAIIFVLSGLLTGLYAAFWWWKASRVEIEPWRGPLDEPVDRVASNTDLIVAEMKAVSKSADLNRRAALWTAASAAFNAAGGAIGLLSGLIH